MALKSVLFKPKSIQFYISRLIFLENSRRNFSTKSSHYSRKSNEDDGKENEQDHLYLYKSKGQHLLTNTRILDAIVRRSNVRPTDTVLEIGPGTGNLTFKLLEAAKKVVAIEIDKRMVEILYKRVSDKGLQDRLHVSFKK